jgi:hypothetical protein
MSLMLGCATTARVLEMGNGKAVRKGDHSVWYCDNVPGQMACSAQELSDAY